MRWSTRQPSLSPQRPQWGHIISGRVSYLRVCVWTWTWWVDLRFPEELCRTSVILSNAPLSQNVSAENSSTVWDAVPLVVDFLSIMNKKIATFTVSLWQQVIHQCKKTKAKKHCLSIKRYLISWLENDPRTSPTLFRQLWTFWTH